MRMNIRGGDCMVIIVNTLVLIYVLYQIKSPWYVYVPLIATLLFDLFMLTFRAGEENGKDGK